MKKVAVYIFLTAFLFGTMEVALKLAGGNMDSFQLTFLRFMIGGLLLLPFAINEMKKNDTKLDLKDLGYLLYVGILCIPVSMLFFQFGVMHSNASTASVLISANPLFTIIFAHFMANEHFNRNKLVVLIFGLLGIVFMIRPWSLQEGNTPFGILMMILAAVTFGLYTVAGKISVKKIGIMAQTSISFIFGSLVLLVIMIIMGKPIIAGVADHFLMVLYISIFVTGMGYYFYFAAIKNSDATTGSIAFFIKPAISPFIAVILLGDKILWNTYVGIFLILIASYLNIRNKKREEALQVNEG
ncbi:DMT family transporter [Clostridium aminobutyricum]|uniref:DMT family transporter n=1 Tax=Clostridium aminobutyricum TaxID=33953 RepID=A0A939D864_CLOAM|nr:DMT family transporter [Clostridium aminobutyricum]MBN7772865.1 DMT family transporter [Clostridium aminobutyricum]